MNSLCVLFAMLVAGLCGAVVTLPVGAMLYYAGCFGWGGALVLAAVGYAFAALCAFVECC